MGQMPSLALCFLMGHQSASSSSAALATHGCLRGADTWMWGQCNLSAWRRQLELEKKLAESVKLSERPSRLHIYFKSFCLICFRSNLHEMWRNRTVIYAESFNSYPMGVCQSTLLQGLHVFWSDTDHKPPEPRCNHTDRPGSRSTLGFRPVRLQAARFQPGVKNHKQLQWVVYFVQRLFSLWWKANICLFSALKQRGVTRNDSIFNRINRIIYLRPPVRI